MNTNFITQNSTIMRWFIYIYIYVQSIYYKICGTLCRYIQMNRIRALHGNDLIENFLLYIRYIVIKILLNYENRISNYMIRLFDIETNIIGFEVAQNNTSFGKIIQCISLSEGIKKLKNNKNNKNNIPLDMTKIIRINIRFENTEINILPEIIKYLAQENNMIDFIKLNLQFDANITHSVKINFEIMEDFFTMKNISFNLNYFENKTIDESLIDFM